MASRRPGYSVGNESTKGGIVSNDAQTRRDILRQQYEEICRSYRAIDDFRAKLLALLPIASGTGGVLLLANKNTTEKYLTPLGIFGVSVTIGLAIYEFNQGTRCRILIRIAARLEEELHLSRLTGQYRAILPNWEKGFWKTFLQDPKIWRWNEDQMRSALRVNLFWAGLVVYGAVIVGWIYVASLGT
jgi:hypothetical protein